MSDSNGGTRPRKRATSTAAAARAIRVEQLPEQGVSMDLDALEREGAQGVFTFLHDRRRYVARDPMELDWQSLILALGNPHLFFRLVLDDADHEAFFGSHLPTWKVNAVIDAYLKHYGLPTAGEALALPR